MPEQLAVNAKRELFLGHGLERAEVRLAGRACERVEAPDPFTRRDTGEEVSDHARSRRRLERWVRTSCRRPRS